ncbi:type II toxin-antitoxin system prevent-host-death family antitoxin [Aminobacter anthyllidis]|uniref:type II toxin-antitoxin system Phd/YefM family antitoxin n=1 Tax=Aminobacter anthyllidis TaxID=1035067 RepID=UPI0024560F0C|nr:type II toxin-antitoxin system prevent-host-death family antitoxin [Aminobacter anthyllidis]MDH4987532.1 type II toxin-antitoxin system prevent-host-death family antitoxin [Aminobacter anthyllidis]
MDETISAADANREFSRLLREVRDGNSFVVTSHGRPVARVVPASEPSQAARAARQILLDRLRRQVPANAGNWSREELYGD